MRGTQLFAAIMEVPMLVLRRKEGQTVCLGGDVRLTVIKVGARFVRIGVEAPLSVRVDREEIRRLRQNVAMARTDGEDRQVPI